MADNDSDMFDLDDDVDHGDLEQGDEVLSPQVSQMQVAGLESDARAFIDYDDIPDSQRTDSNCNSIAESGASSNKQQPCGKFIYSYIITHAAASYVAN